jgi:RHS repeat-associated protein
MHLSPAQPSYPTSRQFWQALRGWLGHLPFAGSTAILAVGLALAMPMGSSAQSLAIGSDVGAPGGQVEVPLSYSGDGVHHLQVDVDYDATALSPVSVTAGPAGADHLVDWAVVAPGVLRIVVYATSCVEPASGPVLRRDSARAELATGELLQISWEIAQDADLGTYPLMPAAAVLSTAEGAPLTAALEPGSVEVTDALSVIEIPTLEEWGLIGLFLLLLGAGVWVLRRDASVGIAASLVVLMITQPLMAQAPPRSAEASVVDEPSEHEAGTRRERLAAPTAHGVPGDADADGTLTAADVLLIVDSILGRGSAPGDPDCNGDGTVDVLDVACVVAAYCADGGLDNLAPSLEPISNLQVREREIVAFTAEASDPDLPSDTLTWSLPQKPVGATIDRERGTLLWVPTGDQVGTHPITVRVTDTAGASDQESFEVTVRDLGGPPVIAEIADQTTVEGNALIVDADATDPDLPADVLTFSLPLAPAGMAIDAATGQIAWTPDGSQVGVHDVTVEVVDQEGLLDFTSFVATVRAVNVAPVASDDVYEARLGVPLTIAAPGVLGNDSDPNADPLAAVLRDDATQGQLTLNPDGSFDYLLQPPDRTTPVELERVCEAGVTTSPQGTIAVGDVDADGVNEIVAAGLSGGNGAIGDVMILNALDCSVELAGGDGDLESAGGMSPGSQVGLFDIDGDGDLEIIGTRERFADPADGNFDHRHLIAIHHDGTLAWPGDGASESSPLLDATPDSTDGNHYGNAGPTFADLDGDGTVEIVMAFKDGTGSSIHSGLAVYDPTDGSLIWEFLSTFRQGGGQTKPPYVVDLDLDGTMEVIIHNSVVSHLGELEFELPSTPSSGTTTSGHLVLGIANVDDDPFPELFGRDLRALYLFEHDGTLTRKEEIKNGSRTQIAVADFDGDGAPEFSFLTCPVAFSFNCSPQFLVVYDTDGTLLWSHQGQADFEHDGLGSDDWNPTAFDANRDGAMDLVMANRTQDKIFVFDGRDGSLLTELDANPSFNTGPRFLTIADLDQDGDAEIVGQVAFGCCTTQVAVWTGTAANPLPAAPTYRNQWIFQEAYNNPDASIPTNPVPHWLQPGRNGWNLLTPEPDPLIGANDTFTYVASDGVVESNEATVTLDILPAGNPPRFLSEPDTLTTRGFEYQYAPIVVDADLGDAVTFQLTAAPDGMTIDPATGEVRWAPEANGDFAVTILALDTIGFAVDQSYTLSVGDPVTVPDVVGQPEADAENALTAANLVVGRKRSANDPSIPAGSIASQSPVAGSVAEFGGSVDLVVSLGPAPEDIDDDDDGFTENQGDCNDGNDGIFPGASETNGDGVDQDCDGFDGSEPVQEIVIEPASLDLLEGERVQLTAFALFPDGTSQIATGIVTWLSLNSTTATVSSSGLLTAVADTGPAVITATRLGVVGAANVNVTDRNSADDDAPEVEITSPADGESVFAPIDVLGTAADPNLVRYELAISAAGEETFTVIGGGTAPVIGGVLAELDPTLMLNGLYDLRLTVLDAGGNEIIDEIGVQVDGELKVGNFTLTYTDVEIPLSGIPISINRTYDSRRREKGDFGVGWTLDLQTMEISTNRVPGTGWTVVKSGLVYLLHPTAPHVAVVRLPNGRLEVFDLLVAPNASPLVPFPPFANSASFLPRPGTLGTLESLDNNNLSVLGAQPGEILLLDDITNLEYNPQRFLYTRPDGTKIVLDKTTGVESVTEPNGNTLLFTDSAITHSNGQRVLFTRDAHGRITRVTDPNGQTQDYLYDVNGDLRSVTDEAGNSIKYKYNSAHGLLQVIDPLNRVLARNEYDSEGRLITTTNADGRTVALQHLVAVRQEILTDADGAVTVVDYDEQGNIVKATDALGNITTHTYDAQGNQLTTTNAEGETTTRTFDARNKKLTETDPLGNTVTYTYSPLDKLASVTDALGRTTAYTYDTAGNLLTEIDPLGNVAKNAYDANGNVVLTQDAEGHSTATDYDASGNMTSRTDALGRMEIFTYDANGNRLSYRDRRGFTHGTQFDHRGLATQTTDPLGNVTITMRDALGNPIAVVDPLGNTSSTEFDVLGREAAVTSPVGDRFQRDYDLKGNLIQLSSGTGSSAGFVYDEIERLSGMTDTDGNTSQTEFDNVGRVTKRIDMRGNETKVEYDEAGRQAKLIDPLGAETTFTYDAAGNRLTRTDPRGNTWNDAYDGLNRGVRTTFPDGSFTRVEYDALGRVVRRIDQLGRETEYEYDGNGNLISVVDPTGGVTSIAYDENGNLISRTDANNHVTSFVYDANHRLLKEILPDGSSHRWSYDPAGNKIEGVDANGTVTTIGYDANSRPAQKAYPDGSVVTYTYTAANSVATVNDSRGTTAYSYDSNNRQVMVVNPDGSSLQHEYDAAGNVLRSTATVVGHPAVVTTNTYDALNRLASVTDGQGSATSYAYAESGNLSQIVYPSGVVTVYSYDTLNRLTEIEHSQSGAPFARFSYTLDEVGNRTRVDYLDGGFTVYEYDDLDRLIRESQRDATDTLTLDASYTYDAVGNRLTSTDELTSSVTEYSYDSGDRLLSADVTTYAYDANGNMVSRTSPGASVTFSYDFQNRLVAVDGDVSESYSYDDDGNRVSTVGSGGSVNYLVDTLNNTGFAQAVVEYDGLGTPLVEYTFGLDLASQRRGGNVSYFHYDGVNSTRLLTDGAGAVTDRYDYDAFGALVSQAGSTPNAHFFTGERLDANTGFYYLRARYYAPETGRFISRDPFRGYNHDPSSLHRYAYVGNNPVKFVDYSGNDLTLAQQAAIGAAVSAVVTSISIIVGVATDPRKLAEYSPYRATYQVVSSAVLGAIGGFLSGGAGLAYSGGASVGVNALEFGFTYGLAAVTMAFVSLSACIDEERRFGGHTSTVLPEGCGYKAIVTSLLFAAFGAADASKIAEGLSSGAGDELAIAIANNLMNGALGEIFQVDLATEARRRRFIEVATGELDDVLGGYISTIEELSR